MGGDATGKSRRGVHGGVRRRRRFLVELAIALPMLAGGGQTNLISNLRAGDASSIVHVAHGPNTPEQLAKHTVVLVTVQGFRADYALRYNAPNLLAMAAHGASAPEGMRPSFPLTALPNSYTLVTGLYPGHHGIVADTFRSADGTRLFRGDDPETAADGSWYGGVPLWALAEQQGMRAACLFWPGSQAEIAGGRPSFYARAGAAMRDDVRVQQLLAWLRLPEAERPHLLVLALAADGGPSVGYGPDSPQTRAAVLQTDKLLGSLRAGIAALHLPVDLVVVSDAAASDAATEWIDLDGYADLGKSRTAGPLIYAEDDAEAQRIYDRLKIADARFAVYRRANLPKGLHLGENARAGDPVVVPTGPFAIRAHALTPGEEGSRPETGSSVYNPTQAPATRTIFYAEGPDVRAGVKLQPFENVNIYPFVTSLLGLKPPAVDGGAGPLSSALVADH